MYQVLVTVRTESIGHCSVLTKILRFDTELLADRAVNSIMNGGHRKDPSLSIYAIPLYKNNQK